MNQLRGSVFLRGTWKNHHYVFCLDVRNNVTCRVTQSSLVFKIAAELSPSRHGCAADSVFKDYTEPLIADCAFDIQLSI